MLRITITKTYNDNAFFEDLKALCIRAGVKGESVTFIFTDAEIKSEAVGACRSLGFKMF